MEQGLGRRCTPQSGFGGRSSATCVGTGGWAVGNIDEINTNPKTVVDVENDEGLTGKLPANVKVFYASDDLTLNHRLSLDEYAANADSEVGSWTLLADETAPARGRARAAPQRPALTAIQTPQLQLMPPTADISSLLASQTKEQRRQWMEQLAQMD